MSVPDPTLTSPPADPAAVDATCAFAGAAGAPVLPATENRYRLGPELARGGMGVVYTAYDTALNRDVAVKCLRGEFRDRPAMAKRFIEEAQITGRLQHPGIPPVHDLGVLPDGRLFLAMKFIAGKTLADTLKDAPPTAAAKLRIFEQVCQTVAFAHARGVIHRDLKPANIMVGAFGEVQVMDWGLSKEVRSSEFGVRNDSDAAGAGARDGIASATGSTPHSEHTKSGSVLGTPAYMSPEQARGDIAWHDPRTDVFALGALLCELLTGQPPFTGTPKEVWDQARGGRLDAAYDRLDACRGDAALRELAQRCLQNDPGHRPADAGEVAAAVLAVTTAAAGRRVRRRAVFVGILGAVLGIAGIVFWNRREVQHGDDLSALKAQVLDREFQVEKERRDAFQTAVRRGDWAAAKVLRPSEVAEPEGLDRFRQGLVAGAADIAALGRVPFGEGADGVAKFLRTDPFGDLYADALEDWAVGETDRWRDRHAAWEALAQYRGRPGLAKFADERPFRTAADFKIVFPQLPANELSPAGAAALGRLLHRFDLDGAGFLRRKCKDCPADYHLHRQLAAVSPADAEACRRVCAALRK